MEDRFDRLEQKIDQRFDQLTARIDGVETGLTGLGARIDGVETGFSARFDQVDTKLDDLNQKVHVLHEDVKSDFRMSLEALGGVKEQIDAHFSELEGSMASRFKDLEKVVTQHSAELKN